MKGLQLQDAASASPSPSPSPSPPPAPAGPRTSRLRANAGVALALALVLVVDGGVAVALLLSTVDWDAQRALAALHKEASSGVSRDFTHGVLDLLLAAALRLVLLPALGWTAWRVGRPQLQLQPVPPAAAHGGAAQPLLARSESGTEAAPENEASRAVRGLRRNVVLGVVYAVVTALSIGTGLKTIQFSFSSGKHMLAVQASLMGSIVVLANLEFFLLKRLIERMTRADGIAVKSIHQHPLYDFAEAKGDSMRCNIGLCRGGTNRMGMVKNGGFKCLDCPFVVCKECLKKKRKESALAAAEGLVRCDYFMIPAVGSLSNPALVVDP